MNSLMRVETPSFEALRRPRDGLLVHATAAGLFAGLVLAIGHGLVALFQGGTLGFPFSVLALILKPAFDSPLSPAPVMVTGLFLHFTLSVLLAGLYFVVMGTAWRRGARAPVMVFSAIAFGTLVWAVNFLVIVPLLFPAISGMDGWLQGLLSHAFLFGAALGLYAAAIPSREAVSLDR